MILDENIPLYFRLYLELRQKIFRGEYRKGSKIESIETLAQVYGISQETVRKALRLLDNDGLSIRKRGLGTIVPDSADLRAIDAFKLITFKNVTATVKKAEIKILSAEWIKPDDRLTQLYELDEEGPEQFVYKIFSIAVYPDNINLKGLQTQYITKQMIETLKIDTEGNAINILIQLAEWLDTKAVKLSETLRPYLCTGDNARLLGVNDGTPLFFQEFIAQDKYGLCQAFEFITTANTYFQKINLER